MATATLPLPPELQDGFLDGLASLIVDHCIGKYGTDDGLRRAWLFATRGQPGTTELPASDDGTGPEDPAVYDRELFEQAAADVRGQE